jgi:hypothetical protein
MALALTRRGFIRGSLAARTLARPPIAVSKAVMMQAGRYFLVCDAVYEQAKEMPPCP